MYDVIVIGAGVTGLGAAWHLTERLHKKVLMLEQFPFPHQFGSSAGHSRITRELYKEDFNCKLMLEAHNLWKSLEEKTGKKLFIKNGLISFDTKEEHQPFHDAIEKSKINCVQMTPEELHNKYPEFSIPADHDVIFNYEAGCLRADKCLAALMERCLANGMEFHELEQVLDIIEDPQSGLMNVTTNLSGGYIAKSVILSTGIWSGKLLDKYSIKFPLNPHKIYYAYYRKKDRTAKQFDYESIASFYSPSQKIYGMCGNEYPDCLKIGSFHYDIIDPDNRDGDNSSSKTKLDFLEYVENFLSKYIPSADLTPVNVTACVILKTPDEQPIIDRHPKLKNLIIGCGFNGSGFKTGVIHGKLLGELAIDENHSNTTHKYFSADRFL